MNVNKITSLITTPAPTRDKLINGAAIISLLLVHNATASSLNPEPLDNCDNMRLEMPNQLQETIALPKETQQFNYQNQMEQYAKLQTPTEQAPKKNNHAIGRHLIGSLFSIVDAVDKLGGDTINLVSLGVNKLNDATINKLSRQKTSAQNAYQANESNNTNPINHETLIQQLLLTGKLDHLLSDNSITTNDLSIHHESLTHQPLTNATINHGDREISIHCPARSQSISM